MSLRLETRRASFTDSVEPDGRCATPAAQASSASAAGVSLAPAAGIALESAQPAGARGGLWTFRGGRGRVETQLLCLARDSAFR